MVLTIYSVADGIRMYKIIANKFLYSALCWLVLLYSSFVSALSFSLPSADNDVVGKIQQITLQPWESFYDIARQYDIGFDQLKYANPGVNPLNRLTWKQIAIPSEFILPPGPRKGIVINIAEMRLYYYPKDSQRVYIFPIGIGQKGWATPLGNTRIYSKIKNPTWHVPDSVSEALAGKGIYLPHAIPPGPQDPLGDYALRLAIPGYLIHGTNAPYTIGMRSSSGCIRMLPEDIKQLFAMVPKDTSVRIIDEPYKIGFLNGQPYLEAHQLLFNKDQQAEVDITPLVQTILAATRDKQIDIDWDKAQQIAEQHSGIPQLISKQQMTVMTQDEEGNADATANAGQNSHYICIGGARFFDLSGDCQKLGVPLSRAYL